MGNESSLVRDCKLEREIPIQSPKGWRLYQSRRRDGSRVSVFVYEPSKTSIEYIENAAKYLKVLRHPSILKFDGMEKTPDGVWLATEQVTPLENKLEEMSSAEIVAGIYSLLESLVFLHERGGLCHNNLCISSVFVSEEGVWKLGGVEYLCRFEQATPAYLAKCRNLRDKDSLAPEEKAGKVDSGHPGWARDAYAFGILAQTLLEYVTDLGNLTKLFEVRIQDQCLDPDPNRRPKLNTFLQDRLFKNDFLQIVNFLKNVTLKSEAEKKDFFWDLVKKLYALPQDVLATRLVRPLLSRFILLDATACTRLLPHLLTPYKGDHRPDFVEGNTNPLLSEKLFRKHVIPELFKIFHVRDVHIRSVLLHHFPSYVHQFDKDVLSHNILPQLLLGIRDVNDDLVQLSLLAIAQLVPILGGDTVVGPHRLKLFVEATPKFGDKKPLFLNHISNGQCPEVNGFPAKDKSICPTLLIDSGKDHLSKSRCEKKQAEQPLGRQERNKQLSSDKQISNRVDVHGEDKVQGDSEVMNVSNSDWSEWDDVAANHSEDNNDSKSPEQSRITSSPPKMAVISSRCDTGSKGALKLAKPVKRRTSPPPTQKIAVGSSSPTGPQHERTKSDPVDKHIKNSQHQAGSDDEERDAWTEEGDTNQWNSNDWQDLDNITDNLCGASDSLVTSSSFLQQSERTTVRDSSEKVSSKATSKPSSISTDGKSSRLGTVDVDINSLDIKTLPIKTSKEPEIDFFADMQPNIKADGTSLWGVLSDNQTSQNQQSNPVDNKVKDIRHKPLSFAAVDIPENEIGDGWLDEEVDWNSEV